MHSKRRRSVEQQECELSSMRLVKYDGEPHSSLHAQSRKAHQVVRSSGIREHHSNVSMIEVLKLHDTDEWRDRAQEFHRWYDKMGSKSRKEAWTWEGQEDRRWNRGSSKRSQSVPASPADREDPHEQGLPWKDLGPANIEESFLYPQGDIDSPPLPPPAEAPPQDAQQQQAPAADQQPMCAAAAMMHGLGQQEGVLLFKRIVHGSLQVQKKCSFQGQAVE